MADKKTWNNGWPAGGLLTAGRKDGRPGASLSCLRNVQNTTNPQPTPRPSPTSPPTKSTYPPCQTLFRCDAISLDLHVSDYKSIFLQDVLSERLSSAQLF